MFTIKFLNVDQGDSIVIEWSFEGIDYIGIIDCNLSKKGLNPVLDFVMNRPNHSLKFMILSHLHEDHFSGYSELFDYCFKAKRRVQNFIHTTDPSVGQIYDKIFTSQR